MVVMWKHDLKVYKVVICTKCGNLVATGKALCPLLVRQIRNKLSYFLGRAAVYFISLIIRSVNLNIIFK